ncbi:MAG: polysaccharide lyase family 1 protein [Polyangia bacterium]
MGTPLLARLAGAILLTLAGCDVHIRPIWGPPDSGAVGPDGATSLCPDRMEGWATIPFAAYTTTTGGGTTAPVTVEATDPDAMTHFKAYADRKSGAAVIQVSGIISFAGFGDSQVRVASNTTILGVDAHSGFTGGGLDLNGNSNIIIKNLVISKAAGTDAITIQGPASSNIWVDHCDLSSERHPDGASYDGLIDITHAAESITISWTKFHDHRDTSIVGHSDLNGTEDTNHLHVTYHHDLFQNVDAGPRIRFGTVHIFNVVFDHVTYYAIASTMNAAVRVEKNYFQVVTASGQDPDYGPVTTVLPDSQSPGFVDLLANTADTVSAPNHITTAPIDFTPPYDVPMPGTTDIVDTTDTVREIVGNCVGPRSVPGTI